MNKDLINLGLMWTAITSTVGAILWMFATFATAAEVDDLKLQDLYAQYYDRHDDRDDSSDEGTEEIAREYDRQPERIRAAICEMHPEWERCDD